MNNKISQILYTDNLIIQDAQLNECDELQSIYETWDDKKLVNGEEVLPEYIFKCLTEGDLPPIPNVDKSNYYLKAIYLKKAKKLIGLIDMYYGFPKDNIVWISIFVLHKDFRKSGIGQEIIETLSKELNKTGYKKIGIGVDLKNWPALRFWTKCGFDKVIGIYGEKTYSKNTFALIGLEKYMK